MQSSWVDAAERIERSRRAALLWARCRCPITAAHERVRVARRRLEAVPVRAVLPVRAVASVDTVPACRPRRTSGPLRARRADPRRARGTGRPRCPRLPGLSRLTADTCRTRRARYGDRDHRPVRQVVDRVLRVRHGRRLAPSRDLRPQHTHVTGQRRDGVTAAVRFRGERGTRLDLGIDPEPHEQHRTRQDEQNSGERQLLPPAGQESGLAMRHCLSPSRSAILACSRAFSVVRSLICRWSAALSARSPASSA